MRSIIMLSIGILFFCGGQICTSEEISLPLIAPGYVGKAPVIDGKVSAGEWDKCSKGNRLFNRCKCAGTQANKCLGSL